MEAGTYRFRLLTDDGSRLFVDGELVIDAWHDQGGTVYEAVKTLVAGPHSLIYEFYEHAGDANAQLSWTWQQVAPFDFVDRTGVAPGEQVRSDPVRITSAGPAGVEISNGVYRVCVDSGCTGEPSFVPSGSIPITDGQYLQLQVTAGAEGQLVTATVRVGGVQDTWNVRTAGDPCKYPTRPGDVCDDGSRFVGLSPDGSVPMFATALDAGVLRQAWPEQVNHGFFSWITGKANTLGMAQYPEYEAALHCASLVAHGRSDWYLPAPDEMSVVRVNAAAIGGLNTAPEARYWTSAEWDSEYFGGFFHRMDGFTGYTGKGIGMPVRCVRRRMKASEFVFQNLTGVALNSPVSSNLLQVTGLNSPVSVSVSGVSGALYRVCSDASCFTHSGFVSGGVSIEDGQYLQLQVTSSPMFATTVSVTVGMNGLSYAWDVTTAGQDSTPTAFTFTDRNGAPPLSVIASNIVQITGITGTVLTTVSGGEYRVCNDVACGANPSFTAGSGSIVNGQYLQLRVTTGSGTTTTAAMTVGTVSDAWTVSAAAAIASLSATASPNVLAGPAAPSQAITWTASASGGGIPPYEYLFRVWNNVSWTWSVVRGYSTNPSHTWVPGYAAIFTMQVWVRSAGSTAQLERYYDSGQFAISVPPGRYKWDGYGNCYWEPNDWGSDQCSPQMGRWKLDGYGNCYWDDYDTGADQCSPDTPAALASVGGGGFSPVARNASIAQVTTVNVLQVNRGPAVGNGLAVPPPAGPPHHRVPGGLVVAVYAGVAAAAIAFRRCRRRVPMATPGRLTPTPARLRWVLRGTVALLLGLSAAWALAQQPGLGYTGTWVSQPVSGWDPAGALRIELRLVDDGVGVRVQRRVTRGTQVAEEAWTCTVDGAPTVEDRSGGRWTRTLRREGGELVWRVVRTVADRPAVTVSERWELSADGRTLQVRSRPEGAGAAVEVRYEFKRVDGGRP